MQRIVLVALVALICSALVGALAVPASATTPLCKMSVSRSQASGGGWTYSSGGCMGDCPQPPCKLEVTAGGSGTSTESCVCNTGFPVTLCYAVAFRNAQHVITEVWCADADCDPYGTCPEVWTNLHEPIPGQPPPLQLLSCPCQ